MSLNSDDIGNDYQLIFHDFTSEVHYQVEFQPGGLTITQDVSQPLLYNYSLVFYVVNDASKATADEISELTLGNKSPQLEEILLILVMVVLVMLTKIPVIQIQRYQQELHLLVYLLYLVYMENPLVLKGGITV